MTNLEKIKIPNHIKLYEHQKRFVERNPDRALLVHEMRTGKSIIAICWMLLRPNLPALVVCPKGIVEKWKRDLETWNVIADVVSRDQVKKINLSLYSVLVLDEAQDFASPLFTKQRSKRAEVIYNYIKSGKNDHILLLTATPVRSTPWNIHTLACYLGVYWNVKEFRKKFFYFTNRYGINHYEKVSTWRKDIRPYIEKISDIVLLKDCFDVPEEQHKIIDIPWTSKQEKQLLEGDYEEPMTEWYARHKMENGIVKYRALKPLLDGYRKVIVVIYYRDQIEEYKKLIEKDRQVFVLHGGINNQDEVIQGAREADDCVFIVQASMGAGFDAYEFSVIIYASMCWKYVDYIQSTGRIYKPGNIKFEGDLNYIYLIGGRNDKSVLDTIRAGDDFNPHKYMAVDNHLKYDIDNESTGTTKEIKQEGSGPNSESPRLF